MKTPNSISEIIESWPTITAFANDLGCGYEAARKMRSRNSVAPEHWGKLVALCKTNKINGVTLEWLASMRHSEAA